MTHTWVYPTHSNSYLKLMSQCHLPVRRAYKLLNFVGIVQDCGNFELSSMYNFHRIILFSELCPPSLLTVHRNQQSEEKQIPNYQVAEVLLHFSRKVNSLKKNNSILLQTWVNIYKTSLKLSLGVILATLY